MRTRLALGPLSLACVASLATSAFAHGNGRDAAVGALIDVAVEVDGRDTALYPAADGSGRYYLEARRGAAYALQVTNRTGGRVGVVVAVDGLNAISGEQEAAAVGSGTAAPGRMYVLDPWEDVTVRGWRTSLDEVRRFTFVDERSSYAARSEQANRKMGWIEVRVYRERGVQVWRQPYAPRESRGSEGEARDEARREADAGAAAPPAAKSEPAPRARAQAESQDGALGGAGRSFPGTGWGSREDDPVRVVSFNPERTPSDTITLRYEYRAALVRLGVLPRWRAQRDRLSDRDAARGGFARAPLR